MADTAAKSPKADKSERVLTKYTVLKEVTAQTDAGPMTAWAVHTHVEAAGPDAAKREALKKIGLAEGERATIVLVPERSFQPATFEVEIQTRVREV